MEDKDIFTKTSVKAIISFRWDLAKRYVFRRQLIPYIGFFFTYLIYAIYIFGFYYDSSEES